MASTSISAQGSVMATGRGPGSAKTISGIALEDRLWSGKQ